MTSYSHLQDFVEIIHKKNILKYKNQQMHIMFHSINNYNVLEDVYAAII